MSTAIVLPELDTVNDVIRVSCWLVDLGDSVEVGDRVVEVLVRGITFDVSAPAAGVVGRIEKPYDSIVVPGETLGWIKDQ